jgi:hypothetical protein
MTDNASLVITATTVLATETDRLVTESRLAHKEAQTIAESITAMMEIHERIEALLAHSSLGGKLNVV